MYFLAILRGYYYDVAKVWFRIHGDDLVFFFSEFFEYIKSSGYDYIIDVKTAIRYYREENMIFEESKNRRLRVLQDLWFLE